MVFAPDMQASVWSPQNIKTGAVFILRIIIKQSDYLRKSFKVTSQIFGFLAK